MRISCADGLATITFADGSLGFLDEGDWTRHFQYEIRKGKTVIARPCDYTWESNYRGYVRGRVGEVNIMLHRLLMEAPLEVEVDHRDRNGMNNRRSNLRFATATEQSRNRCGWRKCAVPYKGVSINPGTAKYRASIGVNKKLYLLGVFDKAEEAALAYDRVAREVFGEFAFLNFPDHDHSDYVYPVSPVRKREKKQRPKVYKSLPVICLPPPPPEPPPPRLPAVVQMFNVAVETSGQLHPMQAATYATLCAANNRIKSLRRSMPDYRFAAVPFMQQTGTRRPLTHFGEFARLNFPGATA